MSPTDRNILNEICNKLNKHEPQILLSRTILDNSQKSIPSIQIKPSNASVPDDTDMNEVSESLEDNLDSCKIFNESFEMIDLMNISHQVKNGELDNFLNDMDKIEMGQETLNEVENVHESSTTITNSGQRTISYTLDIEQESTINTINIDPESIIDTHVIEQRSTINTSDVEQERSFDETTPEKVQFDNDTDSDDASDASEDSDSSYEPADSDDSNENENCLVEQVSEDENGGDDNVECAVNKSNNDSQNTSTSTLNCSFNVSGNACWDDDDVAAELTTKKGNLKKITCCFCEKEYVKIARHLETKHLNEPEVQSFAHLKKKSTERLDKIDLLKKRGNHMFNLKQQRRADGKPGLLKVVRCPNKKSKQGGGNFAVCSKCKGWFSKNNLRHHYLVCQNGAKSSKGILARSRRLQGQIHERASTAMRHKIIPHMKLTKNVKLIRYDLLIILFGNEECTRYKKRNLAQMIRAKLSLLARFLVIMKEREPTVSDFASIYNPQFYYPVIAAINQFAELDDDTGYYKVPSRASEITTNINKMGQILINECIINNESDKKQNAENFLLLCKQGFANVINRTVQETRLMQHRKKDIELPNTTDIRRFSKFLDKTIDDNTKLLSEKFSITAWRDLAEASLIQLQLFNRKRAGEMERFELDDYKKIKFITEKDEGYTSLSKEQKERAKEYGHAVIQGKLYKSVPLLLSAKVRDGINLVVKHRKDANVSSKNPYVFGISGYYKDAHLCASNVMRKLSKLCGADNPELLRGTFLRKQMATKCSEMQLDPTQTSTVADYLGHDVTIHKKVYQQRAKSDILHMSTLLLKAQDPNDSRNDSKGSIEMNSTNAETDISGDTETVDFNESANNDSTNCTNDTMDSVDDSAIENLPKSHTTSKKTKINYESTKPNRISRTRWSNEEEKTLKKYFAEYLRTKTYPSLALIDQFKKKYNILPNRKANVIKAKISNAFKSSNTETELKKKMNKAKFQERKNSKKTETVAKKVNKKTKFQEPKNSKKANGKNQSAFNMEINGTKINDKREKQKNTEKNRVKQHIRYIFDSYIEKGRLPSSRTCDEVKKTDKVLSNVGIKYIHGIIQDQIEKKNKI